MTSNNVGRVSDSVTRHIEAENVGLRDKAANPIYTSNSLESLCELIIDCPHSTPKWVDSGVIVLRNKNIRNGVLDLTSPSFTTEEGYQQRVKRAIPTAGDIIFTREAPMGEVCIIPSKLKCCLGQRQVLLRPKNKINGKYLFWALQSSYVQHQISWSEGTGSTVSNLRIPLLKALKIPRHFGQEDEIATILSSISDKIALNHQINQTLEQMAQALFKSWFVDFDPVKAKISVKDAWINLHGAIPATDSHAYADYAQNLCTAAMSVISGKTTAQLETFATQNPEQYQSLKATADLFPDAMQGSELGDVPGGWEVGTIDSEFEVIMGQSPPGDTYNEEDEGVVFFQGRRDFGWRYPTERVYCTAPKRMAKKGDTLLSVRAPVGDINKASFDCCIGRGLAALRHKSGCEALTYYSILELARAFVSFDSEGTVFGSINQKDLKALKVIKAPSEIINNFSTNAENWDFKIRNISLENQSLTQLRDTLLPKLLSGELIINNQEVVS